MGKVYIDNEIHLIPITSDKEERVFEIFKDCREYLEWQHFDTPLDREVFLKQQFYVEQSQYQSLYPEATYYFISFKDEVVGRLYYFLGETELRILDMGIINSHRSSGIGKRVIHYLIQFSEIEERPISFHVSWFNQKAFNLYQSLGFVVTSSTGIGYEMKYSMQT